MIYVLKATGEREPFDEKKVRNSIEHAGIPKNLQDEVLKKIEAQLYDNISTQALHNIVVNLLDESSEPFSKTKYNLKQAIKDLGPSGYPFEDFVSEILKTQGYKTEVRQVLEGGCVTHEVDVIAEKDGKRIMIEAKFHNLPGTKTKVHVILYTKARFDDVYEKNNLDEAWLITNTKTTAEVIDYAHCKNMKVISWSYPEGGGLRELVEKSGLAPITVSTLLSHSQKQQLLANHVILCRDICKNPSALDILFLDNDKRSQVLAELSFACSI